MYSCCHLSPLDCATTMGDLAGPPSLSTVPCTHHGKSRAAARSSPGWWFRASAHPLYHGAWLWYSCQECRTDQHHPQQGGGRFNRLDVIENRCIERRHRAEFENCQEKLSRLRLTSVKETPGNKALIPLFHPTASAMLQTATFASPSSQLGS